jgi:FlaA1/EpsC-like NDP-sugar epimerase
MNTYLLSLPRYWKQLIVVGIDTFSIVFSVWLAFLVRLEQIKPSNWGEFIIFLIPIFIGIPIFIRFGLYRAIFRYTGEHAIWSIFKAISVYGVIFGALIFFWRDLGLPNFIETLPRSLGVLQAIILLILIIFSRSFIRILLSDGFLNKKFRINQRRTLIYGAGSAGAQIGLLLQGSPQYNLICYADDNLNLRNKIVNGLVIYDANDIGLIINKFGITDILLALPSIKNYRRIKILENLRQYKVHVISLPSMVDIAEGKVSVSDIQELEVGDLLGRESVAPDKKLFKENIANQIVMVTGAGGSIGAELTRQILSANPKILILLELSEFSLYSLNQDLKNILKKENLDTELVPLLGNVRDYEWLKKICSVWKVNTLYHAAAYKHVPIVESNVIEGILNNVWGTLNVARAALETGINQFVLISTDKAVRPSNIMGASKRLAEMVLQALAARPGSNTQFAIVRFGNVLDSSGSVVPLFRSQIILGGSVTVTHPEVTRYFMTIPEAAQLVIQAGAMASISGGSNQGAVFVLDMGKPIRILELAERMIELSGFTIRDQSNPDGDIAIKIIGLRPGEKLYEELLIGDNPVATRHPRILRANENYLNWNELQLELDVLYLLLKEVDVPGVYKLLQKLITGFTPAPLITDLIATNK